MQRLEKLSHNQLLLLGAGVGLLFIIAVVFIFFSGSGNSTSSSQSTNNSITQSPTLTANNTVPTQEAGSTSKQNPNSSTTPQQQWQKYTGDGYTISYPSSWQAQDRSIGTIKSVVLTEKLPYIDPTAPSISIILFPDDPSYTLEDRESFYDPANKRQKVSLGGTSVIKIVNEIPFSIVNGKSQGTPWIDTRFFTLRGSTQYEIITRYQKGASDSQLMIDSILATFRFT